LALIVEHQIDARDAVAAEQPVTSSASACARTVVCGSSSAGHTNVVNPDS